MVHEVGVARMKSSLILTWLVLVVASLGWVFDSFEGQLYHITRGDMLPDLLRTGRGAGKF